MKSFKEILESAMAEKTTSSMPSQVDVREQASLLYDSIDEILRQVSPQAAFKETVTVQQIYGMPPSVEIQSKPLTQPSVESLVLEQSHFRLEDFQFDIQLSIETLYRHAGDPMPVEFSLAHIKKIYRKLVLMYHPDRHSQATEKQKLSHIQAFQEVTQLYGNIELACLQRENTPFSPREAA